LLFCSVHAHNNSAFMGGNLNAYKHTLPSMKSWVPMLTTVHPIALAELRQSVWFSFLSHGLSIFFVLIARSSMVPGTATLISLLQQHVTIFKTKFPRAVDIVNQVKWTVPKKNTIFCNFKELIGWRVNRKIFLEELILC